MASYDSSLTPSDERESGFAPILGAALDPIVQLSTLSASELAPTEKSVFMINCLNFIQSALVLYTFTSGRVRWIEGQIEEFADQLVQHEYRTMLFHSGLGAIVQTMDNNSANVGDAFGWTFQNFRKANSKMSFTDTPRSPSQHGPQDRQRHHVPLGRLLDVCQL